MLKILDTGIGSAACNMSFDEKLLEDLDPSGEPILHLYQWEGPSATYGYFIDPEKHLHLEKVQKHRLNLARRPTGGGIVFHIWDLAFSFLMPSEHPLFSNNTLENYRFVNQSVLEVITAFFGLQGSALTLESMTYGSPYFCMAKPTQYDVIHQGMKIAGAAQRKRKQGYLHQGTISLALPHFDLLKEVLRSEGDVMKAMRVYTFAPIGPLWNAPQLNEARKEIERRLAENLIEKL